MELIPTFTGSVEFSDFAKKPDLYLCSIYSAFGSFCNLLKKLTLSDLLSPQWCVAADNCPGCARLWKRHCHASHAWPQLRESASSCSAICPRPGSLIREEPCGKVCVSLPDVPLSLQLFVREGPRQQHQGAGDHYTAAGVWSLHRHCGGRKGGDLETVQETPGRHRHTSFEDNCPLISRDGSDLWDPKRLTSLFFRCMNCIIMHLWRWSDNLTVF